MSSAAPETPTLAPPQEAACRAFGERVLKKWNENLQMLLGWEISFEVSSITEEEDTSLRGRLPARAVALTMNAADDATAALLLMEPPLAQAVVAKVRMTSDEEVKKQRAEPGPFDDETRESLGDLNGFLAGAVQAAAQGDAKLSAGPILFLEDATWSGGEDPLSTDRYVTVNVTCTVKGEEPDSVRILLSHASADALVKGFGSAPATSSEAAPPAEEDTNAATGRILCLGESSLSERLDGLTPDNAVTHAASAGNLVDLVDEAEPIAMLVADVPPGSEHLLDLVAALRHHPRMKRRPVLVLLENAVRSTVYRAGRLGLTNVLPATADDPLLQRRTGQLLGR